MVFNAGLENMNDEQRQAALTAREQPRAQNANTGLADLMMGQGANMMAGRQFGGRQGQGGQGGQGRGAPAAVTRNLWYINDEGRLSVMQVRIGASSGSYTIIRAPDDLEGKQVILREKI
jgi:hypothetical protein